MCTIPNIVPMIRARTRIDIKGVPKHNSARRPRVAIHTSEVKISVAVQNLLTREASANALAQTSAMTLKAS